MKIVKLTALLLSALMLLPLLASCKSGGDPADTTTSETTEALTTEAVTTTEKRPSYPPIYPEYTETDPTVPSVSAAKLALDSFITSFGSKNHGQGLVWKKNPTYSRSQFFWTDAECFEMCVDAAAAIGTKEYREIMNNAYTGFILSYGKYEKWTSNNYNDDLMWMTIATAKAYLLTGDEKYRDCATTVFGYTFDRAWTKTYGGGMIWYEGKTSKNSCVNYPATIAACLLYQIWGGEKTLEYVNYPAGETKKTTGSYLDVAKMIYGWTNENLRNNNPKSPDYGRVYDTYDKDRITNEWSGTYNLGTCVGAATLLYELTDEAAYLEDARATFHYTAIKKYGVNTVVSDECNGNDLPGFKGIMMRWFNYLVDNHFDEVSDMTNELNWLKFNAKTAWANRNSYNIVWTAWGKKSVDDMEKVKIDGGTGYNVWGCSSVIVMLATFPYSKLPVE